MKRLINSPRLLIKVWIIFSLCLPQLLCGQIRQDTIINKEQELDTIQIPYEEIELDCLCVPKNKFIVIRSYSQLIDLFKNADDPDCKNFSPTTFDFNKEVIIGFYTVLARSGKKIPTLEFSIKKILSQHKYVCEVKLIEYLGGGKLRHPIRKIIKFTVHANDWEVDVEIIDYKNRITQTSKSCYDYYK